MTRLLVLAEGDSEELFKVKDRNGRSVEKVLCAERQLVAGDSTQRNERLYQKPLSVVNLNEPIIENPALAWFREPGDTVGHGLHLAPGEPAAERDSFGEATPDSARCRGCVTARFSPAHRYRKIVRRRFAHRSALDGAVKPGGFFCHG